jgi:polysaccharide pyruvyl transferase WcaK-like protein
MKNNKKRIYRVLLSGYYGQNNLGDDYIFWSILDGISKRGIIYLYVESGNDEFVGYEELNKLYPNVRIRILRTSGAFLGILRKITVLLTKVDYWIIGGGGLFVKEDVAQINHLNSYISLAKFANTKVCMYGIDIDMMQKKEYVDAWRKITKKLDFIYTRNGETAKCLEKITKHKVYSGCDVTHGFETQEERSISEGIVKKIQTQKKYIVWSLAAPWTQNELSEARVKERYDRLCGILRRTLDAYPEFTHVFLPFFQKSDIMIIQDVLKGYDGDFIILSDDAIQIGERRLLFKHATATISMRFHGVQFALFNSTPFAAISYSPKTCNILDELSLGDTNVKFGIKKEMCFGREIDIDEKKWRRIVDDAICGRYKERIEIASKKLRIIAQQSQMFLNEWIR